MLSAIPQVDGSIACFSEQGFVDVGFLCPGGKFKDKDGNVRESGGSAFPPSHSRCVESLADVISFATGRSPSLQSKFILDYVPGIKLLTDNAGVVGWSLG
jgi:hypothetical protein